MEFYSNQQAPNEIDVYFICRFLFFTGGDPAEKRTEDKLTKATRDCSRASIELIHGLMAQVAKDKLFNSIGAKN